MSSQGPPPLPDGYVSRGPERADAELVLAVVGGCEEAELGTRQVDLEDILGDWRRPGTEPARDGVLVFAPDGSPAASAEFFAGRAEGHVLPAHRGRGLGTFLAAWIERRARAAQARFVRQVVPAGATDRLELLKAVG